MDPLARAQKGLFLQYVLYFCFFGVNKFQPAIGAMHQMCDDTCTATVLQCVFPQTEHLDRLNVDLNVGSAG